MNMDEHRVVSMGVRDLSPPTSGFWVEYKAKRNQSTKPVVAVEVLDVSLSASSRRPPELYFRSQRRSTITPVPVRQAAHSTMPPGVPARSTEMNGAHTVCRGGLLVLRGLYDGTTILPFQ